MPGLETGVSTATVAGPSVNAAPSFAPLGDIAPASHGEVAPMTSFDGFVAYNPAQDAGMRGFEGRETPFDTAATLSMSSPDMLSQAADIAAHAWEVSEPSVITQAEKVAQAAERSFVQEQAQQVALYTALFSVPVATPEAVVQEVTAPVSEPIVQVTPEFVAVPQVAQVEAQAEQVIEAVAKEVIAETRSSEEIGQEADAEVAGRVEVLARSLGLEKLASEMADVKALAVDQQAAPVDPQIAEEVAIEGEVLEDTAAEPSAQRVSRTSTYVAARGEVASSQLLPEEKEQEVEVDQETQMDTVQASQDKAKKPEGVLVGEGPMKAVEVNRKRESIADTLGQEAKEKIEDDTNGKISGSEFAQEFRERTNTEALSPILNGNGPDGSVDHIVAPLEGQIFDNVDVAVSLLRSGVGAYTAVTVGNRKDASADDVARVYGGSRRGVVVAA